MPENNDCVVISLAFSWKPLKLMMECDYVNTDEHYGRYELRGCTTPVYMVPNPDLLDKENEYELVETNTQSTWNKPSLTSEQCRANKSTIGYDHDSQDKCIRKKRGCIAICIIMTVVAIITLAALAVGALSLRGSSTAQLASVQRAQDYSHLLEEMSALKRLVSQLNINTQRNISQLDDRLSSSAYSLSLSANNLSTSAYLAISRLSTSVYTASLMASWNSYSVSRLSTSASRMSASLSTASYRASLNLYSLSVMSVSTVRPLSTSVYQLSTSLARCTSC